MTITSARLLELERIEHRAGRLETFLSENLGTNADWPIRLTCDNEATAAVLKHHLNELQAALRAARHTTST